MASAEVGDEGGHEPGPQRGLEGERDRSGLGIEQLAHSRQTVVQLMQHGVGVPFEHGTRVSEPEHAATLVEQRGPQLVLEPGERTSAASSSSSAPVGRRRGRCATCSRRSARPLRSTRSWLGWRPPLASGGRSPLTRPLSRPSLRSLSPWPPETRLPGVGPARPPRTESSTPDRRDPPGDIWSAIPSSSSTRSTERTAVTLKTGRVLRATPMRPAGAGKHGSRTRRPAFAPTDRPRTGPCTGRRRSS